MAIGKKARRQWGRWRKGGGGRQPEVAHGEGWVRVWGYNEGGWMLNCLIHSMAQKMTNKQQKFSHLNIRHPRASEFP